MSEYSGGDESRGDNPKADGPHLVPGIAPDAKTVTIDYIKSGYFRVITADGFIVSVAPTGAAHIEVFNQRLPIPQQVVHDVLLDGRLGEEKSDLRVTRKGLVREVEALIVVPVDAARQLIEFLNSALTQFDAMVAANDKIKKKR